MDTNTMIVIIVALFAVIIVIGFIVYRRKAKVKVEVPGGRLNFEAANDPTSAASSRSPRVRAGILRNWFIGKTRVQVKGTEVVEGNVGVGDTELGAESIPPAVPADDPPAKRGRSSS